MLHMSEFAVNSVAVLNTNNCYQLYNKILSMKVDRAANLTVTRGGQWAFCGGFLNGFLSGATSDNRAQNVDI